MRFEGPEGSAGQPASPQALAESYIALYEKVSGRRFPRDPWQALKECINAVFDSWDNDRALVYRKTHGLEQLEGTAVNIQSMCSSWVSGIAFTANPTNPAADELVIESSYGLGESVVSGEVTPDHFVVNKITLDITERTISRKEICSTLDLKTQRSQAMDVPFERQTVQSLIDDEVTELAWMGKQIEKHYGRPMDIEWAVDKDLPAGGNIFILQARPAA